MRTVAPTLGANITLAAALLLTGTLACGSSHAQALPRARTADRVVLDTGAQTLTLYRGKAKLSSYAVSIGSSGTPKRRRGDRRTPVGRYRLFRGRASKFHRFLPISYPNEQDAKRGLEAGLIDRKQHDAIVRASRSGRMPPQDTMLGGAIGIHGLGRTLGGLPAWLQSFHQLGGGTLGCILVTDSEIEEIEAVTEPGAVVEILPPD